MARRGGLSISPSVVSLSFSLIIIIISPYPRRFVEPPVLNLGETFADSAPVTPLIFVLSPGVDPTEGLRKLAAEKGMGGRFFTVALGQGQVCVIACVHGRVYV